LLPYLCKLREGLQGVLLKQPAAVSQQDTKQAAQPWQNLILRHKKVGVKEKI